MLGENNRHRHVPFLMYVWPYAEHVIFIYFIVVWGIGRSDEPKIKSPGKHSCLSQIVGTIPTRWRG